MKPRIFVSSVMEDFTEYRNSARDAILTAGGEPVLIEDYPAMSVSPRTACLDAVSSCDIYVVIVGKRGGWTAPSGKLVVEEEYEEAKRLKLRILVFVQDIEKDRDAEELVERLSDYISGSFRPVFQTPDELKSTIEKALQPLMSHYSNRGVISPMIEEKLKDPSQIYNRSSLRFVLCPERPEEILDPVLLEDQKLKTRFYEIGHSQNVGLFSYERKKKYDVGISEIVIHQTEEGRWQDGIDEVHLEITTTGVITIDINVSNRTPERPAEAFSSSMVIVEDDIMSVLKKCFAFAHEFFEWKDPFKRYDRLLYNTALSGIGYRALVKELPKGNSIQMGQQGERVIIAFDQPRLITREDLANSDNEIQANLVLFRRRLKT